MVQAACISFFLLSYADMRIVPFGSLKNPNCKFSNKFDVFKFELYIDFCVLRVFFHLSCDSVIYLNKFQCLFSIQTQIEIIVNQDCKKSNWFIIPGSWWGCVIFRICQEISWFSWFVMWVCNCIDVWDVWVVWCLVCKQIAWTRDKKLINGMSKNIYKSTINKKIT